MSPHPAIAELLDALAGAGAVPMSESMALELLAQRRVPRLDGLLVGLSLDFVPLIVRRGRPMGGGHRRWRADAFSLGEVHSLEGVDRPSVEQIRELVAQAASKTSVEMRRWWWWDLA